MSLATYDHSFQNKKNIANFKLRAENIIPLIAGLNSTADILEVLLNKLVNNELSNMILNYSKEEKLPADYIELAQEKNCLKIGIKNILIKEAKIKITNDLENKINNIVNKVYTNSNLDVVYIRVNKIQKFIHETVEQTLGTHKHWDLDSTVMQNHLSLFRLHLNIYDLKSINLFSKLSIFNKYINQDYLKKTDIYEYMHNRPLDEQVTKPLMHYGTSTTKEIIDELVTINLTIPVNEYKRMVIDYFPGSDSLYNDSNQYTKSNSSTIYNTENIQRETMPVISIIVSIIVLAFIISIVS